MAENIQDCETHLSDDVGIDESGNTYNYADALNKRGIVAITNAKFCAGGDITKARFPNDYIFLSNVGKINFVPKGEYETIEIANSKSSRKFKTGISYEGSFEAVQKSMGKEADILDAAAEEIGNKSLYRVKLIYGGANAVMHSDGTISASGKILNIDGIAYLDLSAYRFSNDTKSVVKYTAKIEYDGEVNIKGQMVEPTPGAWKPFIDALMNDQNIFQNNIVDNNNEFKFITK